MNPVFVIVASTIFILGGASMLSLYIGKKSNGSSWATGGRNLPLYVIVGTQYATVMGGGMLVAHIGIGYAISCFWKDLFSYDWYFNECFNHSFRNN
jgi:SSS family solute:Na+ symporter